MSNIIDHEFLLNFLNEFAYWYQNMARKGEMPRALSGISKQGEQFVIRLDSIALPHEERHALIHSILRREQAICYAYGGLLKRNDEELLTLIVATTDYYLISSFEVVGDDEIFLRQKDFWEGENPAEVPGAWFLTKAIEVGSDGDDRYVKIWQELKQQAMFFQRPE